MSKRLLIDTNILIDYSKGYSRLLEKYSSNQEWQLALNPVIVAEFVNDRFLKSLIKQKQAQEFLNLFGHIDLTKAIGLKTGELIRIGQVDYLGDALVAATCLVEKIPLLTRNQKHFKKVKKLELLG